MNADKENLLVEKHKKVLDRLKYEFADKQGEVAKVLDALGSFFMIDESKNIKSSVLVERWQ